MTARSAAAALLGVSLLLASCSGEDPSGSGEQAQRASASVSSSSAPESEAASPSASPSESASRATATSGLLEKGWGPSGRELRRAEAITGRMSLPDLAGQVIVASYGGRRPPTSLIEDLHLGGVIVMSGNIGSTDQLRRSNRALQAAARSSGRTWPVFVGVDQEGGVVERVKGRATRFPAFMSAGAARDTALTRRTTAASGAELSDLGFTVVFAPDADVTTGPGDPTIGSRSASSRPKAVARHMNAAVDGYLSGGILPVIKHFPGHGSVRTDSHLALPVQDKSLRRLRATDLVPFASGVDEGVPAVMVGHLDIRAVDPGTPSSLSAKVVDGLLRRDLGYGGLVVTDALNMGAVTDGYAGGRAAVQALRSGADVVLMPPDPAGARSAIVRAVRDGSLARTRVRQAAARQIALLLHQDAIEPALTREPGSSRRDSYRLSAGAATVVKGPCRGRLVGKAVRATGPDSAVARFNAAAARAGLRTGAGTSVALVGYAGSGATADVVVTLDTPYPLGASRARVAKIAMYGDTPGAMRALVDVLLGKARAPGRLPVPVKGVPRTGC